MTSISWRSRTMEEERQVLTVPEVANVLGISRSLAYELVARGEIPSVRLGRRIVIPAQAIQALLAAKL